MFDLRQLERAHEIVGQAVPPTPAHAWPLLAHRLGTTIVVKHENHTPTSAFKVRGGLVYLDRLKRERPNTPGIISATRGNHGQSLAFAASRHGVPAVIYVPRGNSVEKNRAMKTFGAELVEHGEDFQAAREEAGRRAQFAGLHMVPSFHPDLVLGVATYALELFRSAPRSAPTGPIHIISPKAPVQPHSPRRFRKRLNCRASASVSCCPAAISI